MPTDNDGPGWGVSLTTTGLLDGQQLHTLHSLGITTVEDLAVLTATDFAAVEHLMPRVDVRALEADLVNASQLLQVAGAVPEADYYWFGAAIPAAVSVPEQVADDPAAATIEPPDPAATPPDRPSGLEAINLAGDMQPIRDQQSRSTCVAHAGAAVLEFALGQRSSLDDLSEQFLYWNCKANDGHPNLEGTWVRIAMGLMQSDGALLEDQWPYNPTPHPGDEGQGPPPQDWQQEASHRRALTTTDLPPQDSEAYVASLTAGRPIAFSIPIFASSPDVMIWQNPTGKIPMPLPGTGRIGGHAMVVVGYQPDQTAPGGGFFVIRNSWGTRWAASSPYGAGYGALPRAYVDLYGMEAWSLT